MVDKARITELRRGLQIKAVPFHNLFGSPEGMEVLKILREEFDPNTLCIGGEFETITRAAQHDVIRYIDNMIKLREEEFT